MKDKCKLCGKYEGREKEVKMRNSKYISETFGDFKIPVIHYWKWCNVKNNWCKNVAGSCGEIVVKKEKKLELENIHGLDFKITIEDEL